jgi:hypothetical protein
MLPTSPVGSGLPSSSRMRISEPPTGFPQLAGRARCSDGGRIVFSPASVEP